MPDPLKAHCMFVGSLITVLTMFIIAERFECSEFPKRMYVLPAKTSLLVLAQMLSGILTGILVYLAVAGMAWIILRVRWPFLGPSFFIAIFLAWNMAIMWFAPGLFFIKILPSLLIWGTLLVCIGKRYGIDSIPIHPAKMWTNVTLGELMTMALMGIGAYAIAVVGVSKERCGDSPEFRRIKEWLEKDVIGYLRKSNDFSGPTAAQIWFELRTKGHIFPIANAIIQLMILVAYLCVWRDGTEMVMLFAATVIVPIGCPFFVGAVAGSCSSPFEPKQMDSFRAIRPMSTQALANVMLKNGGFSILLTWLSWLASFVLLMICIHITGRSKEFFDIIADYYEMIGLGWLVFIFFFVAILSWTTMASSASKAMDNRWWITWLPRIVILAISLPLIYFHARGVITPPQYVTLFKTFCWTLGLYCFVRTILAFYKARHKRLIRNRIIGMAALSWLFILCLVSVYALWWQLQNAELGNNQFPQGLISEFCVIFMLAGLLMLPFAPLATAPIALSMSRSQ
ncbi:MAG: hypothetical protein GY845_24430 [Planctomycetes bacterium]|nr:hypothetical protein [Planctomycetota bacterium]